MANGLRIEVPSDAAARAAAPAAAGVFAAAAGVDAAGTRRVTQVLDTMLAWVAVRAYPDGSVGPIEVRLRAVEGGLDVLISDRGHPAADFGGAIAHLPAELAPLAEETRELRQVNLADLGTRLSAVITIPGLRPSVRQRPAPTGPRVARVTPADVEIRDAEPGDAQAIVDLVFAAYGLSYAHPDFYRPEWIATQLLTRRVLATVAVFHGEVVAHHALLVTEPGAAVESAVVVVHPAFRSLGIVSNHLDHVRAQAVAAGAPAILSRAVTHHPYSQMIEQSLGFRTTGLMLGAAAYEDHPRSALTMAYLVLDPRPHSVSLPTAYAELLAGAYGNACVETVLAAQPTPHDGGPAVTTTRSRIDVLPGSEVITVSAWNPRARASLGRAIRAAVRSEVAVVYADVDLAALTRPQLDEVVALLRTHDFGYCGLVLFGHLGHDHLRLQALLTDQVQLQGLVLEGDSTAGLYERILADVSQPGAVGPRG